MNFGAITRQLNFDLLIFRRNPAATFFTVILPLIFLLLFTWIFDGTLENGADVNTVFVPGILTLAVVSATAVNVAITMTTRRERGVLKRVRGTPIDPSVFVLSQSLCLLYTSPSPRDRTRSRMPSSA